MDIRIQHWNDDMDPFPQYDAICAMGSPGQWEELDASNVRRVYEMTWRSGSRPGGPPNGDHMRTRITLGALHTEVVDLAVGQLLGAISTDGSHHKQYRVDQALRLLLGDRYAEVREDWTRRYGYDEGIAP